MDYLGFIGDVDLRERLRDSIQYVFTLYEYSKSSDFHKLYTEETYRVIILYVVSAIEAVLLYFYKERGEKIENIEYKFVQELSPQYEHNQRKGLPVVIAVQERVNKKEHQLGLRELVTFFKDKKLIREATADGILDMNEVRNTFHFNKQREKKCDLDLVEKALNLLKHTIENAPKALMQKSKT